MVEISIFLVFLKNLCAITKVALVVSVRLIFKLDFDFDDDLYWIQALLMNKNLLGLVFSPFEILKNSFNWVIYCNYKLKT